MYESLMVDSMIETLLSHSGSESLPNCNKNMLNGRKQEAQRVAREILSEDVHWANGFMIRFRNAAKA